MADVAPLDVFLMVDSSGSMNFMTTEGISTWSAVRRALGGLLVEGGPASGGYYFDKDPSGPTPPGRIILCPPTGDPFGEAQDRPIEVLVVCE